MRPATILLFSILCLMGCNSVQPQIGPQIVYRDAQVHQGEIQISTNPSTSPEQPLTALVFPFRVLQQMDNRLVVGTQLTEMAVREWGRQQVFPRVLYRNARWPGLEEALVVARNLDKDLLVAGTVPYFNFSGTQGETTVSLHIDVYATRTGTRLWALDQAARISGGFDKDYILARQKTRMPLDPVSVVVSSLARDMGRQLFAWNYDIHPENLPPAESGGLLAMLQQAAPDLLRSKDKSPAENRGWSPENTGLLQHTSKREH